MFSLTKFRESAKDALVIYEEIWKQRREGIVGDDVASREMTKEEIFKIFEGIQGFKNDDANFFGTRYTIQGPLLDELMPTFRLDTTEDYTKAIKFLTENKMQTAIWFAAMFALDGTVSSYWNCNVRYTSIVFTGSETPESLHPTARADMQAYSIHKMLTAMAEVTVTKLLLIKGLERVKSHLKDFQIVLTRLENKGKGSGIKKALGEGPKMSTEDAEAQISAAIAAMPDNALTSRTWGFEIEVPDAKGVVTVNNSGIEKGEDGSLRSYNSDDCECDCSQCAYHECDCSNCDDYNDSPDHDCGYSECAQADSAEFRTTGGILKLKHAAMYDLCEKLNAEDAEMNDSAGTHIHVYANDLTTNQVGQVMAIYTYLEDIMTHVAGRYNVNYAGKMNLDHVAMALKKSEPKLYAQKPIAVNVCHLFGARGTIEFRQMNCNLDAERITFWAWLVRGLVEVAKRGAKFNDFTKVTDINSIIETYAKFNFTLHDEKPGKFIPGSNSDKAFVKVQQYTQA